jgi:hypothetical protein
VVQIEVRKQAHKQAWACTWRTIFLGSIQRFLPIRTLILLPPRIICMHSRTAPLLPPSSAAAPLPSVPHRCGLSVRSVDRGIGHRHPPSPRCSPRGPARQSVPGQTPASDGAFAPPRAPACELINAIASIAVHGRALIRERPRSPAAIISLGWNFQPSAMVNRRTVEILKPQRML